MRKISLLVLAAAGLGLAGAASAADMAPVYTKAPPPVAVPFTWAGSYIGGYVGGAAASKDAVTTNPISPAGVFYNPASAPPATAYALSNSFIGGITSGYNWQSASWVFGYESETGYLRVRNSIIANPAGPNDTSYSASVGDWYSAYTLRVGYAFDRSLIYAKGGAVVARISGGVLDPLSPPGLVLDATFNKKWQVGYAAGAGWEYAFDPKWSFKAEYLYLGLERDIVSSGIDSGGTLRTTTTSIPGIHTGKVGINYKWDWFGMFRG